MPFGSFEDLAEVLVKYQVALRQLAFVEGVPMAVDPAFRHRLDFDRLNAPVNVSEQAISEFLIVPILNEIWRAHSDGLMIWSHVPLVPLNGYAGYFISRHSQRGSVPSRPYANADRLYVIGQPYVFHVVAKKDDFDAAWAHCVAGMVAGQGMNDFPEHTIYGSVSNGEAWFFGKLDGKALQQDPRSFTLTRLDELFAALNYVFIQAKREAKSN